jgi:hypothetical protein
MGSKSSAVFHSSSTLNQTSKSPNSCSALDTHITLIAPLMDGEETDYTSRKKTDLPPELHIIQIYSTVHGYLFFFFNPRTQHGSNRSIVSTRRHAVLHVLCRSRRGRKRNDDKTDFETPPKVQPLIT